MLPTSSLFTDSLSTHFKEPASHLTFATTQALDKDKLNDLPTAEAKIFLPPGTELPGEEWSIFTETYLRDCISYETEALSIRGPQPPFEYDPLKLDNEVSEEGEERNARNGFS
ncbi:hypothetical protein C8J55DRAFT_554076 [Lentinula edodes]|uniref:Uncharacterized protein n=1 Tax=Lentinula lateritia TaxID=40482 RepID=A0A9W9B2F2_9AGAR|nr:hypothetical protein C8J55DRAFT_554076 [Lentinula edodes]